MSGVPLARVALVTPRTRSLPARASGSDEVPASNIAWISPPTRSVTAGTLPLYGTCSILIPVADLNISPARCSELPLPIEPKLSLPGWDLPYSMNSLTVFTGSEGFTTRYNGVVKNIDTGAKSLVGSYGSCFWAYTFSTMLDRLPRKSV